jgi:hypothetical protein
LAAEGPWQSPNFRRFVVMLASPLFPASPRAEIATLPFSRAANGEKPYRARHPTSTDILEPTGSNHLACIAPLVD